MISDMMIGMMNRLFRVLGAFAVVAIAFAAPAHGQSLFAVPDTTPNYVAYRHIEECLVAGDRVTEEQLGRGKTIWLDTVGVARRKILQADAVIKARAGRPDSAVLAARACLSQFNADTATFKSYPVAVDVVTALLRAQRWEDAERFANRALGSVRLRSAADHLSMLLMVLEVYARERPVRLTEATRFYKKLLAVPGKDSLYWTVNADLAYAEAAEAAGDTALRDETWWHAIRANDAIPVEKRYRSRLMELASIYTFLTQEEGFDSLAISAVAYNLYTENTVNHRIRGGALVTATNERTQPIRVPTIRGAFAYTATKSPVAGPSNSSSGSYARQDSLGKGIFPMKGRINYLILKPSYCSVEEEPRGQEYKDSKGCVIDYSALRDLKLMYPDIEIIVLSQTHGTVGELGPLQPSDEADTLAKLFLGHHRVPATLVVEQTEFFHVDAPDGRRIDLPTPMMEDLSAMGKEIQDKLRGQIFHGWFTDKEGNLVWMGGPGSVGFDRRYKILTNRPSQ